ncbi:MAG: UbiA family prenyltransferase [Verrucomicrobiota bacterium]
MNQTGSPQSETAPLRAFLVLGRVSNLPTVWANVVAAWFLAGGNWTASLLVAILAGSLFYIGGMIQNDLMDVEWDRRHAKDRPIPRGMVGFRTASLYCLSCLIAGIVFFLVVGAHLIFLAGLFMAITLYNRFHKRWSGSVWIMGACRALLFLTTASIFSLRFSPDIWLWAGALLIYVAGITLAARGENTGGSVKNIALLLLSAPAILGVVLWIQQGNVLHPLIASVAIFGIWLAMSYQTLRAKPNNIGPFVGKLLAGMVLVDAMACISVSSSASLFCLSLLAANLVAQRYIPAT